MSSFNIRRQTRQRKEYLYRKHIEKRQALIQLKKDAVKKYLDDGRINIPHHLEDDANKLNKMTAYDDEGPEVAVQLTGENSSIDDEYRWAGVEDPKILVTTSRDPSSRLKMFAKELKLIFPNSQRINRGKHEINELIETCKNHNFTDFIIIHETRGRPDSIIVSHLPNGPTAYFGLDDVVMRHDLADIGTMSLQYPNLVFDNFKSTIGERVKNILKYLFPVPKEDSKRVMSFINIRDWIVFRQHTQYKGDNGQMCLQEVGPRFIMRLYKIVLGSLDQEKAADIEYILRQFLNTSRKKLYLSNEPGIE